MHVMNLCPDRSITIEAIISQHVPSAHRPNLTAVCQGYPSNLQF